MRIDRQKAIGSDSITYCATTILLIIGGSVIIGWAIGSVVLTSVVPGWVPMNPTTAMLFIAASCWLMLSLQESRKSVAASGVLSLIIAAAGAIKCLEYLSGWHLGIDQLLFSQKLADVPYGPNRIAPNTALNFLFLGIALWVVTFRPLSPGRALIGRILGLASLLSSALAVVGYFNGVASLYGLDSFIPMAAHTALGFVLLSTVVLIRTSQTSPRAGGVSSPPAGALQRRTFAVFSAATVILVISSIVSYHSIRQFIETTKWNEHSGKVLLAISDFGFQMKEFESSARGYVISADKDYLKALETAATNLPAKINELRALTKDNASLQSRLDALDSALQKKLVYSNHLIDVRRTRGFDAAYREMAAGEANQLTKRIEGIVDQINEDESHLLAQRTSAQTSSGNRTILLIFGGSALWLVVVLAAGWQIKRDGSARAKAEAALALSEQRFRILVDSARDYGIFMLDVNGFIQSWNPGAERIEGYQAQEIIGQHFSKFYPADDLQRDKPAQELRIALAQGSYEEDGWRIRKDGTRFWANVLITCLRDSDGNPIGFSKITRDLTERVRVAEQTQNFFRLSLDLLCIAGIDGYFKQCNPAWEATFGYTEVELKSKPYIEFIHPDDREATLAWAWKLSAGEPLVNFENRYRCKDGSYRWLTWNAAVSSDQRLIYAAARDITNQKQAEKAIAELNATLQKGNLRLEAANKELEAFSYSVSHDLRAPLRGIDGFSQALLEDYGSQLDETAKDYLQRVRAGTQRMGQLIDDMLNLSRVTRSEMHLEHVNISAVASEVIAELRQAHPDRQVQVDISGQISGIADSHMIRVIMDNLISNAWKFTSKRADAHIEIGAIAVGEETHYFVRDNGAGFDMAYADKLFGAFQRLHSAADFTGTGIGLATVQRVIHRHGGRVWAEGAVDQGAAFFFTLPSARQMIVDQAA
jgi:PAS domain S-box-containing protein